MTGASLYLDVWSEAALASFPGLEQADRVSTSDELPCQVEVLRSALAEIRSVLPGIHEEIGLLLQTATPLQKRFPGLPSSSNSALTGAIWFTQTDEPSLLAEMLIHEHSHNKLFLLQDIDPLLDPGRHGTGWEGARHYSPWRDDPRPLNAIVHAYYVLSEAALYWARRLRTTPSEARSLRRFGLLVRQLQSARMVLEEHATFTALGKDLMRLLGLRLEREFIPLIEELGTDDLMAFHMESNNILERDPAASIAAAVRSHRQQWEVRLAAHASSDHAHI
jgi:HEXXH motif-containing protein